MTQGVNKAIVVGFVQNNPVLSRKTTGNYLKVILATKGQDKNPDTFQMEECKDSHTIVIESPRAEQLENKILRGHLLYIEGVMKTRRVKHTKSGLMQNFPEIRAYKIVFLRNPSSYPRADDGHSTSSTSPQGKSSKGRGDYSDPLDEFQPAESLIQEGNH